MTSLDIDPTHIRRLLIREVNWVGDAVLSLPALEAVRRRFPEAEITVLAKGWVAGLFRDHPAVDRLLEYQPEAEHRGPLGLWRLVQAVRALGCDLALILPNSFEAALVPWLAGIPRRVGCRSEGRGVLLTHAIPRKASGGPRHQVHHYLRIVRAVGAEGDNVPRLDVPAAARETAEELLAAAGIGPRDPVLSLNPGAIYGGAKQWGAERFAAASDLLAGAWGARIVLVGSRREEVLLKEVAKRMRTLAVVLGGRTDLPTLAALLLRSRLLLTNDTGAMHVAAATGTPVLAVFGPTEADATGPAGARTRIVRRPVPCSPCLLRECPIDHRCMTAVTVEEVVQAGRELLGG
ncbi:MAG: lipopolysaccharide heptosyltransferase II [candidate division NC10 bacterium]|nr:lipopolysaccharide heptosyltransferase II [candidate division NC10 bacterium]